MKKAVFGVILAVAVFLNFGFAQISREAVLTIKFDGEFVEIFDDAAWFNAESKSEFTKNKSLKTRAKEFQERNETDFKKYFPEIAQIIAKKSAETEVAPYDGHIMFYPRNEERFAVVNAKNGRKLNEKQLTEDIIGALISGSKLISAEFENVPHKTEAKVLSAIKQRSNYSTHFDGGNESRAHNIALALSKFNGLVVANGETVSFNNVVGARNEARGFKQAKIIVDGEFVDGVGGGVCQASTTLFGALLRAGVDIVESHNHSLEIGYVPLGHDAMVSSAADLKFKNTSGAPIYIEAYTITNRAFVKIYGAKIADNLKFKIAAENEVKKIKSKPDENLDKETLKKAKTNPTDFNRTILKHGVPPKTAKTYLEIYSGEKLIQRKLIRKSNYIGTPEIYSLSEKPTDEPAPTIGNLLGAPDSE
ncbi:MAG: VanW family protein [Christensenellaceae bacterium]|jgi:vancomycin resistance protein YoaR|nr:VanW family protein [Christensenellaceae bacterium]